LPLLGWREGWPLGAIAVAHAGAAALTALVWRVATPDAPMIAARAGLLTLSFPLVGPLGAWLAYPARPERLGHLAADYYAFIDTHAPPQRLMTLDDMEEAIRRELSVNPLAEVLRHGDLAEKQAAARALATSEGPEGVAILKAALNDPNDETRLFTSLALLKLEESFSDEFKEARERLSEGSAGDLVSFAELARRYVKSGLPTGAAIAHLWDEIATAARAALDSGPDSELEARALVLLASARLARGVAAEAEALVRRAIALAPDHPEAALILDASLYAQGELDRLRLEAIAQRDRLTEDAPLFPMAQYWGSHEG
jgi:hypothetical protein